jgi:hypothetical protein
MLDLDEGDNMIQMPISEICDRLSICLLKNERAEITLIQEHQSLLNEISLYEDELKSFPFMYDYVNKLKQVNGLIWDLESDIRRGKEGELGLEEVGRRAIQIREYNKQRVSIKNEIVEITGFGFKDIKINHSSE